MKTKVRVAAIQAGSVFLDLDATVAKAETLIKEAATNGADLVAFPEAFFPGYPYWAYVAEPDYGLPFWRKLYRNSLAVPGRAIARISEAARKNNIYVCISGTEKENTSLYLTQFWFDREGNIIGKHRKVRPTCVERTIWAEGDGSMMPVMQTELGRLGGLQCWEHCMVVNNLIMASQNEQIHVAAWPAASQDHTSILDKYTSITATQYYAFTTGTYVLLTSDVLSEETIDMVCGDDEYKRKIYSPGCATGACIINPAGKIISEIIPDDQEGIVYGDIDWEDGFMETTKYYLDTVGHYSKGSVAQLLWNKKSQKNVITEGTDYKYEVSYEQIQGKMAEHKETEK